MTNKEVLHQSLAVLPGNNCSSLILFNDIIAITLSYLKSIHFLSSSVFFLFCTVILLQFMFGIAYGWVAPTLSQLKDSNSLTTDECSWVASLSNITRALGPFLLAGLMDKIGRIRIFVISAFVSFFMWIATVFTSTAVAMYIIRLVFGVASGLGESATSVYLGENCAPRLRGTFNSISNLSIYIGQLVAYILATYLSYKNVAIVQAAFGLINLLSMYLLKETPQWLIMKGRLELAKRHYNWLRDPEHTNGDAEFEETKLYVEENSAISFAEFYRQPEVRKSLRIVIIVTFLTICTGNAAINAFVTMLFVSTSYFTANQFTILVGTIQVISAAISPFIVDKVNRRTLCMTSCLIIAIANLGTAALFYFRSTRIVPYFAWLLFTTISIYYCAYGMLLRPLVSVIRSEILPQNVKAIGNSMSLVATGICFFINIKMYLIIRDSHGEHVNFLIFCFASLLLFTYIYYELPEMRGRTLVEIQKALEKPTQDSSKLLS